MKTCKGITVFAGCISTRTSVIDVHTKYAPYTPCDLRVCVCVCRVPHLQTENLVSYSQLPKCSNMKATAMM